MNILKPFGKKKLVLWLYFYVIIALSKTRHTFLVVLTFYAFFMKQCVVVIIDL